ncbi:MAG TPA: kelch repeat-containing protein [Kofleriaceae bacterium]|nr:kelch repeat-containing protein [Kofleriaceae bacterium]
MPRRFTVAAGAAGLAAIVAVACIEPDTSTCGPLVCPAERVCDPDRVTCVLPAQVTACAAGADGTSCAYPGQDDGVCDHGVCHPSVCGDGFTSAREACDDGNNVDGDGCSARCDSDESCGNGKVDVAVGESCDDGGRASSDGCSSACGVEVAVWHEVTYENGAAGLYGAEATYDAARDEVVMFGGLGPTGARLAETWELDGRQEWKLVGGDGGPPARDEHVLVYDPVRAASVLYGGNDAAGGLLADVWTYDGTWRELTTNLGPGGRAGAAATYDASAGAIVLFGGATEAGVTDETWELRGAVWTRRAVAGPPARRDHLLAYDAVRDRVVLFGGSSGTAVLNDTWEWDGTRWTRVATAVTIPTARGAMVWDAARRKVVLFGGQDAADGSTWEFDGVDWRRVEGAAPPPRRRAAIAYDPVRKLVWIRGGTMRAPGGPGPAMTDTWRYDGAWTLGPATTAAVPSSRIYAGFAYEPAHRRFVLAGGVSPPGGAHADTATFDGTQWVRDVDVPSFGVCASGMCGSRMIEEESTGQLLLVRHAGMELQTWRFDGRSWLRVPTMLAPPPREWFALAYDRARARTVLFGGGNPMMPELGDTWEFDGTRWRQVTPAVSPGGRAEPAMAYDERRGAIVLFGGSQGMTQLDDTWTYDGTTWTPVDVDARPPARHGAAMAYHRARGRVMMFGGDRPPDALADLWELAPEGWRQLVIFEAPEPRKSPSLAYDPDRRLLVMYGGDPRNDTWELRFRSLSPLEACWAAPAPADEDADGLTDCADPDCDGVACDQGKTCAAGACGCRAATELRCGDGLDDDCDGLIDCADPDCAGGARCGREPACGDGTDDDGDGLVDCADPGCAGTAGCEVRETSCADAADNDGDGLVDCADPDCFLRGCPEVR